MWPWVLTLSDVVNPWAGILEGDYVSFFESEHGGKQVMFGIGTVITMLDLRMNSSFGENFVRTTEIVVAVDMLLKKSKLATLQCALNTLKKTHFRHCAWGTRGWLVLVG
jgi:hypothetical protein